MVFINKPNKINSNPLNYRPISLLDIMGKIFESIIAQRLLYFLEYHNLLAESQFGFRKYRNTQQPIEIIDKILSENSKQTRITLVSTRDIQKAFDRVWFKGLLYKINNIPEIDHHSLAFFANYIFNRSVIPTFNNSIGPSFTPSAGVPQGSCLGPILFLIYVNDHPSPIYYDSIHSQFADDFVHIIRSTCIGSRKNKIRNVISKIKKELIQTTKWENAWKIKSSPEKSFILPRGTTLAAIENQGGIKIHGIKYKVVRKIRVLGYHFALSRISINHITSQSAIARRNLNKLSRFKNASPRVKKTTI